MWKRWVVADLKLSDHWLAGHTLVHPFGITPDLTEPHQWKSMKKYLKRLTVGDFYFGFAYIAVGETPLPPEYTPTNPIGVESIVA